MRGWPVGVHPQEGQAAAAHAQGGPTCDLPLLMEKPDAGSMGGECCPVLGSATVTCARRATSSPELPAELLTRESSRSCSWACALMDFGALGPAGRSSEESGSRMPCPGERPLREAGELGRSCAACAPRQAQGLPRRLQTGQAVHASLLLGVTAAEPQGPEHRFSPAPETLCDGLARRSWCCAPASSS